MSPFTYTSIILLILFLAFLSLYMSIKRIKRLLVQREKAKILSGDSVYSAIQSTEKMLKMRGLEKTPAGRDALALLEMARDAYGSRNYRLAMTYCETARETARQRLRTHREEKSSRPGGSGEPGREKSGTGKVSLGGVSLAGEKKIREKKPYETIVTKEKTVKGDTVYKNEENEDNNEAHEESPDMEVIKDLHRRAQEALIKRNDRLPARFTIERAAEAIELSEQRGTDMTEARGVLEEARYAFSRQQYTRALSLANRAIKMAEVVVEMSITSIPPQPKPATLESENGETVGPEEGVVEENTLTCPECGAEITADDRFCPRCGVEIVFAIVCPVCGQEVGEGDRFCRHCGAKLFEKLTCPKCGAEIPPDSRFCPKCGTKL